jgi:hypothetical protein
MDPERAALASPSDPPVVNPYRKPYRGEPVNRKIVRITLSVGAVTLASASGLFLPVILSGCFGSSSNNSPTSGSSGSGGTSGSGGSSGTVAPTDGGGTGSDDGATGTACLGGSTTPLPSSCVIDDMTMPSTETNGYWYTFSDRTAPFATTLVPGDQGIVDPAEGAQFPPDNVPVSGPMPGTGPTIPGLSAPADFRTFDGSGLTLWGAGSGFDFEDQVPPGAPLQADGGQVPGVPVSFDGSAHNGIGFWAKSNITSPATQLVGIHLADNREAAGGGVCDASVPYMVFDGGADIIKNPVECGVDFVKTETFTNTWKFFFVTWADFGKSQNYSGGTVYNMPDTKNLFYLHFQVNNPGYAGMGPIAPEPPFSISIAYVTWYDGM